MKTHALINFVALGAATLALAACGDRETVSYHVDVKPVLNEYCLECHQRGTEGFIASGLSLESYADLMKGTEGGPMVIPGDSMGSNLLVLMEGRANPAISMPHGDTPRVPQDRIDMIRIWIDEGAKNN
ncbi:MAG: hypothetical protein P8008_07920 [Gammaproteobacteria bacterium]